MPPPPRPAPGDVAPVWTAPIAETTFQGAPKWYSQYLEGILKEARRLALMPRDRFGQLTPAQERRKAELDAIINPPVHMGAEVGIPVSITGRSEPVEFTPEELYRAQTDESYARRIFQAATGHTPLRPDIRQFQERLAVEHPEVRERFEQVAEERARADRRARIHVYDNSPMAIPRAEFVRRINQVAPGVEPANLTNQILERAGFAKPKGMSVLNKIRNLYAGEQLYPQENFAQMMEDAVDPRAAVMGAAPRPVARPVPQPIPNPFGFGAAAGVFDPMQPAPFGGVGVGQVPGAVRRPPPGLPYPPAAVPNRMAFDPFAPPPPPLLEERLEAQREARKLIAGNSRIAPLPEEFNQAGRIIERGVGAHDDTFETAREEIRAAGRHDMHRDVQPFLQAAMDNHDQDVDDYMARYRENVIAPLRAEAEEDFLDRVVPHLNMSFAQHGAFHGGVRNRALTQAVQKMKKGLDREVAERLSEAEMKARAHANHRGEKALHAGRVSVEAGRMSHDAAVQRAQAGINSAVTKAAADKAQADALREIGAQRQAQGQNEINTRLAEFEEEQAYPHRALERESMIARGHPAPVTQGFSAQQMGQPTPPNPFNVAGGLLGQMAAMGGRRAQEAPYAKGGHVRAKYATGGHVDHYNQLGKHVQPTQHEGDLQQLAGEFRNYHEDPQANWLDRVSQQMLSNVRGDPLQNIGHGATHATNDRERARDRMLASKEKAANLYEAINNTRMKQHEVLAHYENQRMQMAEQQRHHGAMEGHQAAMLEAKMNKLNQVQLPKLDAVNAEVLKEGNKNMMGAPDILTDLDRLEDISSRITTGTATTKIPGLNDPYFQSMLNQGSQEDMEEFDKVAGDLVLKSASAFGARAGARIAAMYEKAKPHRGMSRKGIQKVIGNMKKVIHDELKRSQHINKEYMTKGILPSQSLGEYSVQEHGPKESEAIKETSGSVQMIGPDGSQWNVPAGKVSAALSRGATYG